MKIFPVRFGMLHSSVMSFGCSRIKCRPTSSETWRAASKSMVRRIGTKTCSPVLPEVLTIGSSDMPWSNSRSQKATSLPFSNATVLSSGSWPLPSLPE